MFVRFGFLFRKPYVAFFFDYVAQPEPPPFSVYERSYHCSEAEIERTRLKTNCRLKFETLCHDERAMARSLAKFFEAQRGWESIVGDGEFQVQGFRVSHASAIVCHIAKITINIYAHTSIRHSLSISICASLIRMLKICKKRLIPPR